jgi:hypothetical protein
MTLLRKRYDIVVYGLEKWDEMEIGDHDFRHRFNVHLPTNHFIDYSSPEVIEFVSRFRKSFSTEPDHYAFIGHDILLFFGRGLMEHGNLLPLNFHRINKKGLLSSDFDLFKTGPESGYENNKAFVVQYKDQMKKRSGQ